MSYYYSAIATIAAYGSMMTILLSETNIIHSLQDQREIGYPYDTFSAVLFYGQRELLYVGIGLLIVLYFIYHNEKQR
jgi:ABC-type branched-subunit amino acid transport system permease subunit